MSSTEIEVKARAMGWKPEAEWKGDPPPRGFVDAETFVEAGEKALPVVSAEKNRLQQSNRDLEDEVDALKAETAALRQGNERFKVFTEKALSRERKEKQDAIGELETVRAKAISESDGETAVAAEKQIRGIEKEIDAIPDEQEARNPEIDAWMADNKWYRDDPETQAVADGLSMALRDERPDLIGTPHLDELTKRVKKAMPHKFTNPRRAEADTVEGGRRTPIDEGSHTFENLPADAKAEYQEFADTIPGFTKDAYVEQYEW